MRDLKVAEVAQLESSLVCRIMFSAGIWKREYTYTLDFNCRRSDLCEFLEMLIIGNENVEFQESEYLVIYYLSKPILPIIRAAVFLKSLSTERLL